MHAHTHTLGESLAYGGRSLSYLNFRSLRISCLTTPSHCNVHVIVTNRAFLFDTVSSVYGNTRAGRTPYQCVILGGVACVISNSHTSSKSLVSYSATRENLIRSRSLYTANVSFTTCNHLGSTCHSVFYRLT